MAKAKKTDCQLCGTPRPREKVSGYCGDCMDFFGAVNRFNVRAMAVRWSRREHVDGDVVMPALRYLKWSVGESSVETPANCVQVRVGQIEPRHLTREEAEDCLRDLDGKLWVQRPYRNGREVARRITQEELDRVFALAKKHNLLPRVRDPVADHAHRGERGDLRVLRARSPEVGGQLQQRDRA